MKLSVTRIHRVATEKKPCQNVPRTKTPARCEFDCIDRIRNRVCYNCSKYGLFSRNATLLQCVHSSGGATGSAEVQKLCEDEEADHIVNQLLECKRKCVPPCKERVYTVGAVTAMNTIRNEEAFSDDPNFEYLQVRMARYLWEAAV